MRRLAVTGSSGRVGRALVARLRGLGHVVIPIDVSPQDADTLVLDLNAPEGLREAFTGVDGVVHLAAFMSWDPGVANDVLRTNVNSTYNVLEAAAAAGVQRVAVGSSGEVYPENHPQYLPLDERHPTEPRTVYGLSKLLTEEVARFYARTTALEVVILRFSHTQDAEELADPESTMSGPRFFLAAKAAQQERFGNHALAGELRALDHGDGRMYIATSPEGVPFRMGICETRDLVEGIIRALDAPGVSGEAIGIGAPRAASFDEIVLPIAAALHRDVVKVPLPGPAVNYETSNSKASALLGYQPEWPIERMIDAAISAVESRKE
ncbi:MAG: NAD-dependent epimerase/dehydratase family protein [Propioniciclava sp.]